MIRYLHANYGRRLNLDDIAAEAALSRDYLTRCFQQVTGLTPVAYLRRLRLAESMKLLRETDRPIAEVAARVGMQNPSSFCRQFKAAYGISPLQTRRDA